MDTLLPPAAQTHVAPWETWAAARGASTRTHRHSYGNTPGCQWRRLCLDCGPWQTVDGAESLLAGGCGLEYVATSLRHRTVLHTRMDARLRHPRRAQVVQVLQQH